MSDEARSTGIGVTGALFITFVILRLTDHIDWAWYWVASPLWLPLAVFLAGFLTVLSVVVIVYGIAGFVSGIRKGLLRRKRQKLREERERV